MQLLTEVNLPPSTSQGPTFVERVLDERKGGVGMTSQRHTAEEIITRITYSTKTPSSKLMP